MPRSPIRRIEKGNLIDAKKWVQGNHHRITVQKAAASPKTLIFMLIVVAVMIPIILIYTSYEFWVFRGKVRNYYKKEGK